METLLFHGITPEEFFERLRNIIKEELKNELQKDQLLTKEGALKMAGISNTVFLKAINELNFKNCGLFIAFSLSANQTITTINQLITK